MITRFLAIFLTIMAPASVSAQEFFPLTVPVPLSEADPNAIETGDLVYRGGLKIEPGEEKVGGISGLEWHDDALWAVSDDGRWLRIEPNEANGELRDLYGIEIGPLLDDRGKKFRRKEDANAEANIRTPDGGWLIAFEQDHRIARYAAFAKDAAIPDTTPAAAAALTLVSGASGNSGLEALAIGPAGLLACAEIATQGINNCVRIQNGVATAFQLLAPPALAQHNGAPTDAACADDGTCYVLFRSYRPGQGNRAAIVELAPDNSARTLAVLTPPLTLDNFEGLAVRDQYSKRYLYLASDDNFNNCYTSSVADCQDTLILKFQIRQEDAAPPPVADAPEPDAQYETVDVVLETVQGPITIALETERAPITAANFLRYVEEGRFDGTVFYRAMSLDAEPKPNGLLQGGTQFDPKRILPPIAHEPTSATGLSHTHGAVSMAMGDPGTANGDFSIMLQDQTGLDAQPDATDPVWKNGYAVFGYVIEGMNAVAAIYAGAIDPDKGEGWMKGQMLADPVKIVKARRADPEPPAQ